MKQLSILPFLFAGVEAWHIGWGQRGGPGWRSGWGQGGQGQGWGHHPTRGWYLPTNNLKQPSGIQNSTFSQLIDHNDPSKGTFNQSFWYSTDYWKGPGSPVVIMTPGEVAAAEYTGYLANGTLTGLVAQEIGAATIVIEHRYWGQSSPFSELTTENLQYLTVKQAIADLVKFANDVDLPFSNYTNAKDVPWILIGGSYSGALTAWTEKSSPGTFWAYIATSAPVQTISNYWTYFEPVRQGMPQNCSKDVALVINHMDDILNNGTSDEINALKTKFGLAGVEHNDDFMSVLENGPFLWQGNSFYGNSGFFTWCDYIENAVNATNSTLPGPNGVGLDKALNGYATWVQQTQASSYCSTSNGTNQTDCFNTYDANSSTYTDVTVDNPVNRQWMWMLCNEPFGYWQTGAPSNRSSIVSRLIDVKYSSRQCQMYFPPGPNGTTFGIARGLNNSDTNTMLGGWEIVNTTRLIYVNGQYDPWREASVASDFRPNGALSWTEQTPTFVIPGGFHCSDLIAANGQANQGCQNVIDAEISQISQWVGEYRGQYGQHAIY